MLSRTSSVLLLLFACCSCLCVSAALAPYIGQAQNTYASHGTVDGSSQFCQLDKTNVMLYDGTVTGIQLQAINANAITVMTWRLTGTRQYRVIGRYAIPPSELTGGGGGGNPNALQIPVASRWASLAGDVLGYCVSGAAVVGYVNSGSALNIEQTTSGANPTIPNVGTTVTFNSGPYSRTYALTASVDYLRVGDLLMDGTQDAGPSVCTIVPSAVIPYAATITAYHYFSTRATQYFTAFAVFRKVSATQYEMISKDQCENLGTGIKTCVPAGTVTAQAGDVLGFCNAAGLAIPYTASALAGYAQTSSGTYTGSQTAGTVFTVTPTTGRVYAFAASYTPNDLLHGTPMTVRAEADTIAVCTIDLEFPLTQAAAVRSYHLYSTGSGTVRLATFRTQGGANAYTLIGQYLATVTAGFNAIPIPAGQQWMIETGDYLGWCETSTSGLIQYDKFGGGSVRQSTAAVLSPVNGGTYTLASLAPRTYSIDVAFNGAGTVPSGITGDPQFVGYHGQQYQVHGVPNEWFALVATPTLHMNGHFRYLTSGRTDYNHTQTFSHVGTYIDDIAIQLGFTYRIRIKAGPLEQGITLIINDQMVQFPKCNQSNTEYDVTFDSIIAVTLPYTTSGSTSTCSLRVLSSHRVSLTCPSLSFNFIMADFFLNTEAALTDHEIVRAGSARHHMYGRDRHDEDLKGRAPYPKIPLHGLIGGSWRNALYLPHHRLYEGDAADYLVTDAYDTRFAFTQWHCKEVDGQGA